MPNAMTNPNAFNRAQSAYVPKMMYSADVNYNGGTRVDFGLPAAASATNVLNAIPVVTTAATDLTGVVQFPEPYGRTISILLGAAGTPVVTINGWDYLGQPISEAITAAGTGAVAGKKAFKSFRNVNIAANATLSIGSGASLGLPYKALRCQFETAAGALVAAGTLIAPILVAQTATTGDPRGTYTPTTAMNGATWITAVFDFANDVDTVLGGGLHGIQQFAA
jgi:hypothetical protein